MTEEQDGGVLVLVVETKGEREISWGSDQLEKLSARMSDVAKGLRAAITSTADALPGHSDPPDWQLSEVKAKFGITISTEAGVIISRAGADATLEFEVTFARRDSRDDVTRLS